MKRATWRLILGVCFIALLAPAALAQGAEPALILGLQRDFGYGGFGEIQGAFRLTASGAEHLTRVVFLMDDQALGEITQAPWQLRFHTDNFPPGSHTMAALGYTESGQELRSNEVRTRFLSSQEAGRATTRLIVTLLGGILGLMALSALVSTLLFRGRARTLPPGTPRNYGLSGGTVCRKCGRPFARHLWAPNMLLGKLERCPYCGKWGSVRAASRAELAAAEAAEVGETATTEQASALSEHDQLQRDLDDSRFQDQ